MVLAVAKPVPGIVRRTTASAADHDVKTWMTLRDDRLRIVPPKEES